MLTLACRDEHGNPVFGFVEVVYVDGSSDLAEIDQNGCAYLSGPFAMATIKPIDGHWNVISGPSKKSDYVKVVCPTISLDIAQNWWRKITCSRPEEISKGKGIRIGVIDIPFRSSKDLPSVKLYDIEGEPLDETGLMHSSHGARVCRIISERAATGFQSGLAGDAEVIFVDVSDSITGMNWDFEKLAPAIELLVDDFAVDIINISGGVFAKSEEEYEEVEEFLQEYINYAGESGAVIFAAVGNDSDQGIALPASMTSVIGVGAIGLCGVAPSGTLMAAYERVAHEIPGAIGWLPSGEKVFHYCDSGHGAGIDAVGPGIGIVMRFDDGVLMQYEGTSYACPSVVATMACIAASSEVYLQSTGLQRHRRLIDLSRTCCADLGMDRLRQGWGLPIVK